MKLSSLLILLITISLISCKPRKNSTTTTTGTDSSANTSGKNTWGDNSGSSTSSWSSKDKNDFVDECVKKASEQLSTGDATTYCRCMQESIEKKYPVVRDASGISNSEMGDFRDKCLQNNNIKLGTGSTGNDDGGSAYSPWSESDKKTFMDNCSPGLVSSMGASKANDYCECMLQKIMVLSPDSRNADNIQKEQMTEWAKDCLK